MTNVVELTPEMEEQEDGMWPAISLLLKRMETHPEEFANTRDGRHMGLGTVSKWNGIIAELEATATPEDFAPLKVKLYQIHMEGMYAKVVENLCRDAEEPKMVASEGQLYMTDMKSQLAANQAYSQLQQLQNLQNYAQSQTGLGNALATGNGGTGQTAVSAARNSLFKGLLGSK